ncbi:hypothetical protein DWV16_11510 [Anaerotruncus sp. AF02-27]|uniref:hypothetical protein n=1 Tax=Anaerotruncus sp. AF02-27 TaxID=2292191 RepID=UPI000E4E8AEB|nr:hypothetical protein [Anaerotruncus sp. AF02-27]RGX54852.1 hypothetical protein DWV16_11510 [Anaerotruncus sp. AF02-27]
MNKEQIFEILRMHQIPNDYQRDVMWYIEKMEPEPTFVLCHIFNYGMMAGKQAERARRGCKHE